MRASIHMHVLALSMALASAAPARAQDLGRPQQADAGSRAAARREFGLGQQAFARDDYETALRHFRRALELFPHDAVLFNVAVCLERLQRWRDAAAEYDAAAISPGLDEPTRAHARDLAARARSHLGGLAVDGVPLGAAVRVDGEDMCTIPCRTQVDPGPHHIVVHVGASEASRDVRVRTGAIETVRVELDSTEPEQSGGASSASGGGPDGGGRDDGSAGGAGIDRGASDIHPGALTWTGAAVALAGTVGVIVFGLEATSIHDEYLMTYRSSDRDDGVLMRDLANVALATAVVGAALVAVDLFLLQPDDARDAGPSVQTDARETARATAW